MTLDEEKAKELIANHGLDFEAISIYDQFNFKKAEGYRECLRGPEFKAKDLDIAKLQADFRKTWEELQAERERSNAYREVAIKKEMANISVSGGLLGDPKVVGRFACESLVDAEAAKILGEK